ncbi:MAG: TonB-dependent receptor plug domain-containing protein, partial [Duncaniella sp.]|nr:TonB-dependent receptor plug domain-containing protein [Duncaniella sp.]
QKETYGIPLEGRQSIKITLVDTSDNRNNFAMEAVEAPQLMDLGYGYVDRRERTTASDGITGAQLKATGATDILTALQGLVAGLDVRMDGTVRIRGQKTLIGSSQPLFLVDGVEVFDFAGVNINDVERVEVMKDAPIYGSRGANGAILVTTKR